MASGQRSSAEAIKRDRDASRERARLRRSADREQYNAEMRKYNSNNREQVNETRRVWLNNEIPGDTERPFIGWDGEGGNEFVCHPDGTIVCKHRYILFGCSHFPGDPLVGRDLSTETCLDYLLDVESKYPDAFHVGFAFNYDVNMILRDLESRKLRHLADYGMVHWHEYRIAYIPGKRFTVSRGNPRRGEKRISVTVYDVFGFFHSKYTTSLIKFGVATEEKLATITAGKDKRGSFIWSDIEYVKKYWQAEIAYMPLLMDRVREACYDAGFFIREWHGPGALAAYILRKRGVNEWHSKDVPVEAQIASRYAYAGGRFQFWRFGLFSQPCLYSRYQFSLHLRM